MDPEALMRRAIEVALGGIEKGQSPFGCAIARGDELLACRHNTVLATLDITAHAEVNALRTACLETDAIHLRRCDRRDDVRTVSDVHGRAALGAGGDRLLWRHDRRRHRSRLQRIAAAGRRVVTAGSEQCATGPRHPARTSAVQLFQAWKQQPGHRSY